MAGGRDTLYSVGFIGVCSPDSPKHYDSPYCSEYSDSAEYSSPETAIVRGSSISDMDMMSYNDHRQISSKVEYRGHGGGYSGKVRKTCKSGAMVDGRNGNHVYKEEVDYDYSLKVTDENLGITTQYETQIKHKKTTSYANPSSGSSGGKSSGKIGYTSAKRSKISGSGGGKCEIVGKYSSYGKSSGCGGRGSSSSRAYGGSKTTKYSPY